MKIKKLMVLPIATLLLDSTAFAEDVAETEKNWAASIGTDALYFRKSIQNDNAVFVGLRLALYMDDSDGSFSDNDDYLFGVDFGYRSYASTINLKKFIDSSVGFTKYDNSDYKSATASVTFGVEHDISESISVEGAAGIGLSYSDFRGNGSSSIYIPITRLAVNYHF